MANETQTDGTTDAFPAYEPSVEVIAPDADPAATELTEELKPTVAEAEAMFADNKGLSSVVTDAGILTRDGVIILVPVASGE